ncbi:MAG TPA: hypothetical protein DEA05_07030 [Rhodobacteraceae bacterium]|nr:hypothetical protein [Paracoccaceae bacterium]
MLWLVPLLAACSVSIDQIEPAVSQFNGDSVSIQLNGNQLEFATQQVRQAANAKADARAAEICRRGHRKRAEHTSTRNIPTGQYTYVIERLYLCLN